MSEHNQAIYEFGPFRLDAQKRLLLREGEPVKLFPKEFDTLLTLVERSGELLDKDELMRRVWGEVVVEESNLTTNISHLRKILGEKPNHHQYIVTVPGQGYRFVAGVRAAGFDELMIRERTRVTLEQEEEACAVEPTTNTEVTTDKSRDPADIDAATQVGPARLLPATPVGSIAIRSKYYPIVGGALVLLLASLAFIFWQRLSGSSAPDQKQVLAPVKSIAVLPFRPLVEGGRDEALEMGMADTLITKLSNIRGLVVRPISAVRKYGGLEQDSAEAGREQRVDAVLDGSIQKSDKTIRVSVRLVKVSDESTLWASQFDQQITDIFAVQDSISHRVAAALALTLTGKERERLTKRYTENAEAYQLYLIGRNHWNGRTEEKIRKGIDYFNKALEKDPEYALAHAGLSDSYGMLVFYSALSPKEGFPKAKAAAIRALDIDDNLAEAHTSLASVIGHYDWDFAEAEREFERAIELNPNYPTAHHWYSLQLAVSGRFSEAISEARLARDLDPLSPIINSDLGQTLRWAGRLDDSIDQLHATIAMHPDFAYAHFLLGLAYLQKGAHEQGIAELHKSRELFGGRSEELGALGHAYATSGRRDKALKLLSEVNRLSKQRHISPLIAAGIYLGLGDKDRVFELLEKAYQDRDFRIGLLLVEPAFVGLKSDPRYADLLKRARLAP